MKKSLMLVLVLLSASAKATQLDCVKNSGGFSVRNLSTNQIIGAQNSRYNTFEVCMKAINTKVENATGYGVVCASSGEGSGLFTLAGAPIAKNGGFYYEVALCKQAVDAMSDWVVCTPGRNGSIMIDLRTGNEIPVGGYYNSIEYCAWSSRSASAKDNYVCAPYNGDSRIYDRKTGAAVGSYTYAHAEGCYNELKKMR